MLAFGMIHPALFHTVKIAMSAIHMRLMSIPFTVLCLREGFTNIVGEAAKFKDDHISNGQQR
jgi:hypothetical protein